MTKQVNFRVEENLKIEAEKLFDEMGLSMSTALTMFLKRVVKERKIPFEVTVDVESNEN